MSALQVQQLVDEWRARKVNAITAYVTNKFLGEENTRSLVQDDDSSQNKAELVVA
jgi:hypothetical protein